MARLPLWISALWWGSLTTIGFLVVPLLFMHLPTPALAGGMAAKLFAAQTWVSVLCGIGLLLQMTFSQPRSMAVDIGVMRTVAMIVLTGGVLALLSEWVVAPQIVTRENLRFWHSLGSVMYVLQWLCATATCWKLMSPRQTV